MTSAREAKRMIFSKGESKISWVTGSSAAEASPMPSRANIRPRAIEQRTMNMKMPIKIKKAFSRIIKIFKQPLFWLFGTETGWFMASWIFFTSTFFPFISNFSVTESAFGRAIHKII